MRSRPVPAGTILSIDSGGWAADVQIISKPRKCHGVETQPEWQMP
jgi:hypothetical protein